MDLAGKLRQNRMQLWGTDQASPPYSNSLEAIYMRINHLLVATTFASLFLFGTSLYAQQDVDPSWYDPVPASATAPSQAVKPASQPKAISGLPEPQVSEPSAKRLVSQQSSHGHKATMSQKSQLLAANAVSTSKPGIDEPKVGQVSVGDERHAAESPKMASKMAIPVPTKTADEVESGLESTR
jgi:hypothetical protein